MRAEDVKYGPVYHWKDAVFYAAAGSICYHDNRKEDFCKIQSIDAFRTKARAVQEQLDYLTSQGVMDGWAMDMRADYRQLLTKMDDCIRDAKEQGDPMDPATQKWYMTHKPWKGGRVSMGGGVAPNTGGDISYEIPMPPLPLGEFTGKTA